jgi:hypothetical protein
MTMFSRIRTSARRLSYLCNFTTVTAFAVVGVGMVPAPALASDDWGCQVLLCVSNPGGATQYPACVPPITKLWKHLSLGGAFPTCTGGGVSKTKVNNLKDPARRSVTMTYDDGRRSTLSLAGIEGNGAP